MTVGERGERWQLLDLVIDTGLQTVTRGGEVLALPRLSFQFLLELVRAAPNVVSSDELMERVWAGVFVNGETVTQRAKLLRDALGDDPREPRYFGVRRGVGYHLLAPAERMDRPASHSASARRWPKHWLVAMAIVVLTLGGLGVYGWHRYSVEAAVQQPLRVAVLPFDNLSSDPADAYIAQGIPEMVLNRLSAVPGLEVIARESALFSKAAGASAAIAGKELNADFVIKGSVQKIAGTLRVTCFVLDTAKGTRRWSQSFDWPVDKVYALQDRIASQVAATIAPRPKGSNALAAATYPTRNADAYLAYLKGKALLGRMRVAETDAAGDQFQRAIQLDPTFAPAKVALYDARMQAASLRSEDLGPVRARYEALLREARAADPASGAAMFAEAMWSNRSRDERLALFAEAARRDPSNARGLVAYAQLIEWGAPSGSPSPLGEQLMSRVMALDPLSADAQFWSVQREVFRSATPAEVEAAQRRALTLDPDNVLLTNRYAVRRWRFDGETAEAIGLMERILATDPQYARSAHVAFAMYLDAGDPAAARSVAGSTPATRDSSRALLALYAGDWRAAGEAALSPRGFLFNQFENWLWPEAVRDYGVKAGRLEHAAQAIASRYGFDLGNPRVGSLYQVTPSVPLAHLLLTQGETEKANRLLASTIRWLEEHPRLGLEGGTGRARAEALMLLGQQDKALSVLLASVRNAHDIMHCWYYTRQEPIWVPAHRDPRFQEIAGLCEASMTTQRRLLDAARRAGKVPVRGG